MSLVVKNLTKNFGSQTIMKNFDITIEEKEIVALVGESGTGKTTFIRILNDLEKADGGSVRIDDTRLFETNNQGEVVYSTGEEFTNYRNNMGMVFQEYHLFPNMTAMENLVEAPIAQKIYSKEEAEKKAFELLQQMGLEEKKDAMPKTLSGGQQQRVAIARSMMLNPKFLCFDEPTSALDRISANVIGEMIKEIAQSGTGIIIVTHDVAFAEDFSTRILEAEEFIMD